MSSIRLGFVEQGRAGYLDEAGSVAIGPRFDRTTPFSEGLAAVCVGGLWGFIDVSGEFLIEPRFRNAHAFSEGAARVEEPVSERGMEVGTEWVFVNRAGSRMCPADGSGGGDFSEGLARISLREGFRYLRPDGTIAFECRALAARSVHDGRLAFARDKTVFTTEQRVNGQSRRQTVDVFEPWGFIDASGAVVLEPRYDEVTDFAEGLAAVRSGSTWVERPYEYQAPGIAITDSIHRTLAGGEWTFIDVSGSTVLSGNFRYAGGFSEGVARVYVGGEYVDEPYAQNGVKTILHRLRGGLFGYIDRSGTFELEPSFEHVENFSEGLARFYEGERWGYINRSGTRVIPAEFTMAEDFESGFAKVTRGETWGYVDRDGRWLWHSRANE